MNLRTKELPDLSRGRDAPGSEFCMICHKPLKPGGARRWGHIVGGSGIVLHPGDDAAYVPDAGDVGAHPIGSDCAKTLGLEWSTP